MLINDNDISNYRITKFILELTVIISIYGWSSWPDPGRIRIVLSF